MALSIESSTRRRRRSRRPSRSKHQPGKPSSSLLDRLLATATTGGTSWKQRKGRSASSSSSAASSCTFTAASPPQQQHHPSLIDLMQSRTKDFRWSTGSSWFARLSQHYIQDVHDLRVIFHTEIKVFLKGEKNETKWLEDMQEWLARVYPRDAPAAAPPVPPVPPVPAPSQFHSLSNVEVVQEWWLRFSEFGAPSKSIESCVQHFVDDTLLLFLQVLEKTSATQTPTPSPASSPPTLCTRALPLNLQNTMFLLSATIASWCLLGREGAAKFQQDHSAAAAATVTTTTTTTTTSALLREALLYRLRASTLLPHYHSKRHHRHTCRVHISEAVACARVLSHLSPLSPLSPLSLNKKKNLNSFAAAHQVMFSESALLAVVMTPSTPCDCVQCTFTLTKHGLLDGCPLHDIVNQVRSLKSVVTGSLQSSNDASAYVCSATSLFHRMFTMQESVDRHVIVTLLNKSSSSSLTLDVVLADAMQLPLEVANIIVSMLMKPSKYGKVLYRRTCLEL